MAKLEPSFPTLDYVLNDSPVCHQSLRHWGKSANEVCILYIFTV